MLKNLRLQAAFAIVIGSSVVPAIAHAQWEFVPEVPPVTIFSMSATGDTIAAGADSVVFLSTDGGKNWRQSARPVTARSAITAVRMRNHTLFAASFGQGVST